MFAKVNMKNWHRTPKNPKMCDPILVTLLKMQPRYSQSSRESVTPSSRTSPLASYKEVPSPQDLTLDIHSSECLQLSRLRAVSFSSDLVRGVHGAARREKRGRQPEKKKEPLPSRAFSHARGHLCVSGDLLDGPTKKRDCSQSTTFPPPPLSSSASRNPPPPPRPLFTKVPASALSLPPTFATFQGRLTM